MVKGLLAVQRPVLNDVFTGEAYQRFNDFREVFNKPPVKIVESNKRLYLLQVSGSGLVNNYISLSGIHS